MLVADEKQGGSSRGSKPCPFFHSCLQSCELLDLGYRGPKYTWHRGTVSERLDRGLCNLNWRARFDKAVIDHLPRIKSDHRPILLSLNLHSPHRGAAPFRFLGSWLLHRDFRPFVARTWNNSLNITQAMSQFASKAAVWNREVYGNIFARKKRLLARLSGIEKALNRYPSRFLHSLEEELRLEYESVQHEEELFWKQKANAEWIKFGDRNTAYFHAKCKIKKNRTRIGRLQLPDGTWCSNDDLLRAHVVDFYRKLYSEDTANPPIYPIRGRFAMLSAEEVTSLMSEVTEQEIREALFAMQPLKAPGHDGLCAAFFQSNWEVVKTSLVRFASECMSGKPFDPEVCRALISLIPKKEAPMCIADFRTISLLPVVFKVFMKMITNRVKPLLPKLIAGNQSSFVPGRQIVDNVVIMQALQDLTN